LTAKLLTKDGDLAQDLTKWQKMAKFITVYRPNGILGVTNSELGVSYATVYRFYG
jgi:hypothetical protein